MRLALALGSLCMLAPAIAAADDPPKVELHVNAGAEFLAGNHVASSGFRFHAGLGRAFGSRAVRPSLTLGLTAASSDVSVHDLRALDGSLGLHYVEYGPETQLALRFADGGRIDSRIFAGFALLHVEPDARLALDGVPGVGGSFGFRAAIGANWADKIGSAIANREFNVLEFHGGLDWLMLLAPQQVELGIEHSMGSTRFGITFSFGI